MTTDPEHPVVPEELAELRRVFEVGLTRIEGQLALHAHRDDQNVKDQDDLSSRISALEHNRWPLPAVAALTAIGALAIGIWQVLGH
ncbi:hypothetical protein OKJ48_12560 [Streptomyces kunmingensis]|uniref:DUF3618 domain-containing protein n=1 Tax=Streptomyces kunmingensis TaxID=68225 RepID=A0ABU6CA52_9ACTN|nr:hypothetical protein [Streptomyces kunmingensis]MEB3961071.1 hypothetical protein [Streptomyces kunmingensis]